MSASELLAQILEDNRKGGGSVHAPFVDFSDVGKDRTRIIYGPSTPPAAQQNSSNHVPERSGPGVAPVGLNISHAHFGKVAGNETRVDLVKDVDPQQLHQLVHPGSASTTTSSSRSRIIYKSQDPTSATNFPSTKLSDSLGADTRSERDKSREKWLKSLNKKS